MAIFRKLLLLLISFSVIFLAIYSVQRFASSPIGGTAFWWAILIGILIIFFVSGFTFPTKNKFVIHVVTIYLLWNVSSIIRGLFVAEIYWDWKNLVTNGIAIMIPIVGYAATNKDVLQSILSAFIKYALPLFVFLVAPFYTLGVWGWYLFPITLLMFFLPAIKFKWKILLILVSLVAMFGNIAVRSHIFKYGIPIILLSFFYIRHYMPVNKLISTIRIVFLLLPWFFFTLALIGVFNVFNFKEYINLENASEQEVEDLATDSRTFLYEEVLQSAEKYNYIWLGRTPARGNETKAFAHVIERGQRQERNLNEASILNVFTWTGLVGVVLYFIVFAVATHLAINKSNSLYMKLIGLFVAFRWMYAWVEDETWLNMNCFVIWLMLGMCFSTTFRKMNNLEMKVWARGIFEKKYMKYSKYVANDGDNTSALKFKPLKIDF